MAGLTGVVFDIETKRHRNLRDWMGTDEKVARLDGRTESDLRQIAAGEEILIGNLKDPEKIKAKIRSVWLQAYEKAAMKLWGCEIVSIAAKLVNGVEEDLQWIEAGQDIVDRPGYAAPTVWTQSEKHNERSVVGEFLGWLEQILNPVLMGFNIRGLKPGRKGFDIPILRARAAMLGEVWPDFLPKNVNDDRRSRALFDITDVLHEGNLDTWLRAAGLPVKIATGFDVQNMEIDEISTYNADDVEKERLLAGIVLRTQTADLQETTHD